MLLSYRLTSRCPSSTSIHRSNTNTRTSTSIHTIPSPHSSWAPGAHTLGKTLSPLTVTSITHMSPHSNWSSHSLPLTKLHQVPYHRLSSYSSGFEGRVQDKGRSTSTNEPTLSDLGSWKSWWTGSSLSCPSATPQIHILGKRGGGAERVHVQVWPSHCCLIFSYVMLISDLIVLLFFPPYSVFFFGQ